MIVYCELYESKQELLSGFIPMFLITMTVFKFISKRYQKLTFNDRLYNPIFKSTLSNQIHFTFIIYALFPSAPKQSYSPNHLSWMLLPLNSVGHFFSPFANKCALDESVIHPVKFGFFSWKDFLKNLIQYANC